MVKVLVTGANGQIGVELVEALYQRYGKDKVIASSRRSENYTLDGPFETLDVRDGEALATVVKKYHIEEIYHMAAILSAVGEQRPLDCWHTNMDGLLNVLEVARECGVKKVFCPSSMAVYGPSTPKEQVPQETILEPSSMYGISKVAGELLGNYYVQKYGLDVRGIRYPGIISNKALPGGGTTDYAVDIYYQAVQSKHFNCFVKAETILPMMYMPDCLKATLQLMDADFSRLKHHANYNVASMSFSAEELYQSVKKYIPELTVSYQPDFRQQIADSWSQSIDDHWARDEWGWQPDYDLDRMSQDMLAALRVRQQANNL